MQTIEELVEIGYKVHEAKLMIESSQKHIGEKYGCNIIVDIIYTPEHERDILYRCELCGKESHKLFVNGRNKWSEFPHSCICLKSQKDTASKHDGTIRNDDESFLGQTYGDFTVKDFEYKKYNFKSGGMIYWACECIHCGKIEKINPSIAKKGKQCNCQKEKQRNDLWNSRIGERYGKLVIEGFLFRKSGVQNIPYANCICDCGNRHTAQYNALLNGSTKSCGCIEAERCNGRTKSPLYGTWYGMRDRCNNPKSTPYKDYGGRGIMVCKEWDDEKTGLQVFEAWAWENGYAPDLELTLDRIDVNGNYEPGNCRYVNTYIQTVNRRESKQRKKILIEVDGEKKTKEEWCKEYGISVTAVDYRMKVLNMPFEFALKTPKSRKGNIFAGETAKRRSKELNRCESYIEANLLLAFIRVAGDLRFSQQDKIGKYRVDFIVEGTNVVVECDGYDNHKTKEQINHDNKRDRYLQKEGYVVLRFSGSEINEDPEKCALEIVDFVKTRHGDLDENRKTNAG